jgi:hypothetical protein
LDIRYITENRHRGPLPPFAAFAHRKNWIAVLNVCFFKLSNLVCTRSEGPASAFCSKTVQEKRWVIKLENPLAYST